MTIWKKLACSLIVGYSALACLSARAEDPKPPVEEKAEAPKVDLVFVLDTTGSMGGLIEGAKRKIWSITNEIARGKPTPDIRIGLVAFQDKGDKYVVQQADLTEDIDGIYKTLMGYEVGGGGDGPEHVNAGLKAAIDGMSWSAGKDALKLIFLVGDAPPHEDYGDDFDHKSLAKKAIEQDIVINTIRCGSNEQTEAFWKEIAKRSEGRYFSIAQDGNVAAVTTPFDKDLAELGGRLDGTRVLAGGERERRKALKDAAEMGEALDAAPEEAKADRAGAAGHGVGAPASESGVVDLAEGDDHDAALGKLKESELPDEMQKMTEEERKAFLEKKSAERDEIMKKIADLDSKRAQFIKEEMKKRGDKDSFDSAVTEAIHEQAKKKGIAFEE